MKERILEMLNEKEWTFADLQNMTPIVNNFVEVLYGELTAEEKLRLIWEIDVEPSVVNGPTVWRDGNDDPTGLTVVEPLIRPFGMLMQEMVTHKLTEIVIETVKTELLNANVSFGKNENKEDETNEVSESSMDRKPPKRGKTVSKTSRKDKK